MKIKLMIALVIMALVFGMVLIACDDGDLPVIKDTENSITVDTLFLGVTVDKDGKLTPTTNDTFGVWYHKPAAEGVDPVPLAPGEKPDPDKGDFYKPNKAPGSLKDIMDMFEGPEESGE
jgi:hypothetical protein